MINQKNIKADNLFNILQKGDRKISMLKKKCIAMVGLTRAGKSTTFNWIINKPLIGAGEQDFPYYQNGFKQDQKVAELGCEITSVTLVPNMYQFNKDTTLIDMAGYNDKRDHIGVMGVSYFLKATFQIVEQVKFIIVISEDALFETSGDTVINTLKGFVNMFKIDMLDQQLEQQFFSSLSMVVTKSERKNRIRGAIDRIIKMLQGDKLIIEKRKLYVKILTAIAQSNRFAIFELAVVNQQAQVCNFIDRFNNNLNWKFVNLKNIQSEINTSFIQLPFLKDYENLVKEQKKWGELLFKQIHNRIQSYQKFSILIRTLKQQIEKNFQIEKNELTQYFNQVIIFLNQNDVYESRNLINQNEIRHNFVELSLFEKINLLIKISRIIQEIGQTQYDFKMSMTIFDEQFEKIILILRQFCSNQKEDILMLRILFVLKRGFRQFSMLFEINPEDIVSFKQNLKDYLKNVFEETNQTFLEYFISKLKYENMKKMLKKKRDIQLCEKFFKEYEQNYGAFNQANYLTSQKIALQLIRAQIYKQQGNKNQALLSYLNLFNQYAKDDEALLDSEKNQDQINRLHQQLSMKKYQCIQFIKDILLEIGTSEANGLALSVCQHINDIHSTCIIFQMLIKQNQSDRRRKMELLGQYASYCCKWGRIQKAIILYQNILSLERRDYGNFYQIKQILQDIVQDSQRYMNQYYESLKGWNHFPPRDDGLNSILVEIKQNVLHIWD